MLLLRVSRLDIRFTTPMMEDKSRIKKLTPLFLLHHLLNGWSVNNSLWIKTKFKRLNKHSSKCHKLITLRIIRWLKLSNKPLPFNKIKLKITDGLAWSNNTSIRQVVLPLIMRVRFLKLVYHLDRELNLHNRGNPILMSKDHSKAVIISSKIRTEPSLVKIKANRTSKIMSNSTLIIWNLTVIWDPKEVPKLSILVTCLLSKLVIWIQTSSILL